jgi:antirestriction protein ArdC
VTRVRKIDVGSQIGAGLSGYIAEQVSARICYELGLPADLHESHASYVSHWLEILKADKTAIITAAAKADQAFNHLAAYSGYQSEPAEDEGEEADETAPVPACA